MTGIIKFYCDEHVAKAVIRGLRNRGIDVVSTPEAGMIQASDTAQLTLAREGNRVLVTADDDFLRLHASGMEHAGIAFVSPERAIGEIVRGLELIHKVS